MPNPVVHFEIMGGPGSDLPEFYSALFGWPVDAGEPVDTYAQFSHLPPQGGGIGGAVGATDGSPFVTVYVEVEDIEDTCERVRSLGGEIELPPTTIPQINHLRIARVRDPQGNLVGVVQRQ